MKHLVLSILLILLYNFSVAIERPDFIKAVADNKITPTIVGSTISGSPYGEAAEISIQNETGETIETVLEKGTILESENPDTQDLVVSKDLPLQVGPYEYLDPPVSVFCIEINNKAPTIFDFYKPPSRKATGDLMKLIDYIDRNNLHDSRSAQLAVWSITDDLTMNKAIIDGYGSSSEVSSAKSILDNCNIRNSFSNNDGNPFIIYFFGIILYCVFIVFILKFITKAI